MGYSRRDPFQYFRFLRDLAGYLNFTIHYEGRRHKDTIFGELLDVLDIHHFRIQTIFLNHVLNQVV